MRAQKNIWKEKEKNESLKYSLNLIIILIALSIIPNTLATINLTDPLNLASFETNKINQSVSFSYDVNIDGIVAPDCTLIINSTSYSNYSSSANLVLKIGSYAWSILCANETSDIQTFNIVAQTLNVTSSAAPVIGTVPLQVVFSASASYGISPYSYLWNFGDGGMTAAPNFTYTYQQNGSYNATLLVTDAAGQTYRRSYMVTVNPQTNFSSTISMDKSSYYVGENAHIVINAPINSSVQLRYYKSSSLVDSIDFTHSEPNSDYIYLLYSPYPVSTIGNYTLKAYISYKGTTNNYSINFALIQPTGTLPLSSSIVTDKTTVNSGEDVLFQSSVSGGVTPYTYEWDTTNDGIIDGTSASITTRFGLGNKTLRLTVRDSNNSVVQKTLTINSIQPTYDVTITVVDAWDNSLIQNADVNFAAISKTSGTNGATEFSLNPGNYTLKVSKENYTYYEKSLEITSDISYQVKLNSTFSGLFITIKNPKTSSENNVQITYGTNGNNPECTLFLKENGWWSSKGKYLGSGEKTFNLNLDNGNYEYKVTCTENGRSSDSTTYSMNVGKDNSNSNSQSDSTNSASNSASASGSETKEVFDWIDETKQTLDLLDLKEKEAASQMKLANLLEEKKKTLTQIDRDMANLKFLTGNQDQIDERKRDLTAKLRDIKGQIPKSINVIEDSEFVKYARIEDIKSVLNEIGGKNDTDSVDVISKLQGKISINTKVKKVEVTYYYADKKVFILVEHTLDKKESLENHSIIEVIPKSLVKSTKDITFLNSYNLIKEDPIVEVDISDKDSIAYYFESEADLANTQNIRSVLMNKNYAPKTKKNSITGFAINGIIPVKLSDTKLLLEVFAIIILVIAYVLYSFEEEIKGVFSSHDNTKMDALRKLIGDAMQNAERGNTEQAYLIYTEIKLLYKSLLPKDKQIAIEDVKKLANEINMHHSIKVIDEGLDLVRAGKADEAKKKYDEVQETYPMLSDAAKERVKEKSMHLFNVLSH